MNAKQCLRKYNQLTSRLCDGIKVFPRRMSRKTLAECEAFLEWCALNRISPERWIRSRHASIGWKFRIPLNRLSFAKPEYMEKFREWADEKHAVRQIEDRISKSIVGDVDRRVALTVLSERAKAEFSTNPMLCMLSRDFTLGWHPKSSWCQQCDLSITCRGELPLGVEEARCAGR